MEMNLSAGQLAFLVHRSLFVCPLKQTKTQQEMCTSRWGWGAQSLQTNKVSERRECSEMAEHYWRRRSSLEFSVLVSFEELFECSCNRSDKHASWKSTSPQKKIKPFFVLKTTIVQMWLWRRSILSSGSAPQPQHAEHFPIVLLYV